MSRRGSSSSIPVQIQCLNDDGTSSSIRNKIFRRASSSQSNKSDNQRRRSSLRNLFSKADERAEGQSSFSKADENDDLQDDHRLQLFKSKEFQAYLKEHNIVATAGLHIIFQQFLQERNTDDKGTVNERVGVTASAYRRKSSGDSFRSFAGGYTTSSSKRRGTNVSEHTRLSENSLDDSMWSIDDSSRRNYMSAIRGDTESIFRQPQEVKETEQQLMNDAADEEESKLKSFFRKSSDAMSSIDASYRNRRDSLLSTISGRGLASSMPSGDTRWEASCKVEHDVADDSSVGLEDLMKHLGDDNDDAQVEDDKSNNGEVEIFFPTRRRSLSWDAPRRRSSLLSIEDYGADHDQAEDDESNNGEVEFFFQSRRRSLSYDTPPRRASLISKASETSSQLQKCLNEIRVENIRSSLRSVRVNDEESNASDDGNSLASDKAFLCTSNNAAEHARLLQQPNEDFLASGDTLLVEWGEAKYDSEDDCV